MEKSRTLKKSVVAKKTVDFNRVAEWTKKEFKELRTHSKTPVCIKLANGDYVVASYTVKKVAETSWLVENKEFADKRSAIFYCALKHLGQWEEAEGLLEIDEKVSVLSNDKEIFRKKLDNAHLANDEFKIGLFESRFTEIKTRLTSSKLELEKIINFAKYCNVLGTINHEINRHV